MLQKQKTLSWALGQIFVLGALITGCGPQAGQTIYGIEIDGKLVGSGTDLMIDTSTSAEAHPVSFKVDKVSGPAVVQWIASELASDSVVAAGGTVQRKSISVVYLNDAGEETMRVNLGQTQLDVFALPTLTNDTSYDLVATLKVYPQKLEKVTPPTKVPPTDASLAIVAARNKTQGDFNQASHFNIEIDGIVIGGVHTIDGLESEHDIVEYKDSQDGTMHMRPGNHKPGKMTVTRDWTNTPDWADWYKSSQGGAVVQRKSISVIFQNDAGQETLRITMPDSTPIAYTPPDLNSKSSGHATESIEISWETMELK